MWNDDALHRRRIYTEEKAKVVAASWATELLQFLAALAILHPDKLKNRLICTLFFNSSWCKIASAARNQSNSVLQEAATTFAFLLYLSFFLVVE